MRHLALALVTAVSAALATPAEAGRCRGGRCSVRPPRAYHQIVPMGAIEYVPKVHRGYEIRSRRPLLGRLFPMRRWVPASAIEDPAKKDDSKK